MLVFFLPVFLLLLLVGGRLVSLAEDLFEVSYLGKEHVPEGPPHLAFITMIFSPEIVVDELVDLHTNLLQRQLGRDVLFDVGGRGKHLCYK